MSKFFAVSFTPVLVAFLMIIAVGAPVFAMFGIAFLAGDFSYWFLLLYILYCPFFTLWYCFCIYFGKKFKRFLPEELTGYEQS